MNTTFWFVPAENFREQRNIWKGSPVFPGGIFQTEIHFYFFKAIFNKICVYRATLHSWSFLGKWNWFVEMVTAIPGRHLPVLEFAYHLPKPKTDRCVCMRERAGSVPEISFFPTEISVSGLEILPYEDFRPVTEIKEFWWSGWHCLALPAVFSTSRASHLTAVIQL